MTDRAPDPRPGGKRRTRRSARRPAGPPAPANPADSTAPEAGSPAAEDASGRQPSPPTPAPSAPRSTGSDPAADGPQRPASSSPVVPAATPAPAVTRTRRQQRGRSESAAERTLRSLVSSRPTQLSPTAAMRAREVAVPTEEDLAEAARDLVLVRRNYVPPAPLRGAPKQGRSGGKRGDRRRGERKGQDGKTGADGSAS